MKMDDKGGAVNFKAFMLMGLVALAFVAFLSLTLPVGTTAQEASTMNFTVANSAPTVGTVTCGQQTPNEAATPGDPTDTYYRAWCYATLTDNNGYQDIFSCNGTFFRTSVNTGAPDTNIRYSNNSCQLVGGTGNTVDCNCTFFLRYWADGNVGWTGNLTAKDPSTFGYAAGTISLASLAAMDLTASKVQWGSLTVNTQTTFNINNKTVSNNTGNVNCSIQMLAAANIMDCVPSPADITYSNIKGWITDYDQAYTAGGTALPYPTQGEFTPTAMIDNRQNTPNSIENRTIYWALSVPTGVNGTCTITVNMYPVMVSSPAQ